MQDKPTYLNEKQVSKILGLSLPTLRNYRHLRKGWAEFGTSSGKSGQKCRSCQ